MIGGVAQSGSSAPGVREGYTTAVDSSSITLNKPGNGLGDTPGEDDGSNPSASIRAAIVGSTSRCNANAASWGGPDTFTLFSKSFSRCWNQSGKTSAHSTGPIFSAGQKRVYTTPSPVGLGRPTQSSALSPAAFFFYSCRGLNDQSNLFRSPCFCSFFSTYESIPTQLRRFYDNSKPCKNNEEAAVMEFSTAKMKEVIKQECDFRVGEDAARWLDDGLQEYGNRITTKARQIAQENGRKTVRDTDIKQAIREVEQDE